MRLLRNILPSTVLAAAGLLLTSTFTNAQSAGPQSDDARYLDTSLYERALDRVQFAQYVNNEQSATLKYGLDVAIPRFGLEGFPPELEGFLREWKDQVDTNIKLAGIILKKFNKPTIPPCKYIFDPSNDGSPLFSFGFYLAYLLVEFQIGVQANLVFSETAARLGEPGLAVAATSVATNLGRKAGYLRGVAGANPAPDLAEIVVPSEFSYWQTLYFTVPGSCPVFPFKYPPLRPLQPLSETPPPSALTPGGKTAPGAVIDFAFNNTVINAASPGAVSSPPKPQAKYVAFIEDGSKPPTFKQITVTNKGGGVYGTKVKLPTDVKGSLLLALTSDDKAKSAKELVPDVVAGPFYIFQFA